MNRIARGSLLGIEHMEAAEIVGLLKLARRMNPFKPRPLLRGKRVLLLFYEASTRNFKGASSAGGSFVEQKKHAFSPQQRAGLKRIHSPCQLEQAHDLRRFHVLDSQQGTTRNSVHGLPGHHVKKVYSSDTQLCFSTSKTFSLWSVSRNWTSMISCRVVCTLRPTNVASTGNSRWPRSISTQSRTCLGRPCRKRASSAARVVRPV